MKSIDSWWKLPCFSCVLQIFKHRLVDSLELYYFNMPCFWYSELFQIHELKACQMMPRFSFSKEGMNHGINLSKHKTMYQKAQKFHTANKAWFCSIIAFFVNLSDKSQNLQDNLTVSESRRWRDNTERSSRWRDNNTEHCRKGANEQVRTSQSIGVVETSVIWLQQKKKRKDRNSILL